MHNHAHTEPLPPLQMADSPLIPPHVPPPHKSPLPNPPKLYPTSKTFLLMVLLHPIYRVLQSNLTPTSGRHNWGHTEYWALIISAILDITKVINTDDNDTKEMICNVLEELSTVLTTVSNATKAITDSVSPLGQYERKTKDLINVIFNAYSQSNQRRGGSSTVRCYPCMLYRPKQPIRHLLK